MVHSTNAPNTLICPAEDCKARAKVPDKPGSVAALQFAMLKDADYRYTSDEVLSGVAAQRKGIAPDDLDAFRDAFFSKGQPCFRASPLTKTHGWAVHGDADGRIALVDPDTSAFSDLADRGDVTVVLAMRNKRA